jgi:hypothetical protein
LYGDPKVADKSEFEEGEDEFEEVSKSKKKISSESDDDILSEK